LSSLENTNGTLNNYNQNYATTISEDRFRSKPNSAINRSQLSAHNQITYKTVRIEHHFCSPTFNIQKIEFRAHEIWIAQHVNELVAVDAQGLKTTLPLKLFRNKKREHENRRDSGINVLKIV